VASFQRFNVAVAFNKGTSRAMPERDTKSSDKFLFDELRRANERLPPKREADLMPVLPFYDRHPEWRPRPLTRRQLRRRIIREG
jgi:hypothetical protein